jgi:signal transduction histidine kinase
MRWAESATAATSAISDAPLHWLGQHCMRAWRPFWRSNTRTDQTALPLHNSYLRRIACFAFVFLLVTLGTISWGEHLLEQVLINHVKEMLATEYRAYPVLDRHDNSTRLARAFAQRDQAAPRRERVAAVQSADGSLLYGHAELLSPTLCGHITVPCQGWLRSRHHDHDGVVHEWLGHATSLPDGGRYVIAYDILPMLDRIHPVPLAGGAAMFMVLLISLGAACWFNIGTVRQIERIRAAMARFAHGELDARVPLRRSGDEFDYLGRDINHALARIEQLMEEVRNATNHIAHELRTPLTRLQQRLNNIAEAAHDDVTICSELSLAEQESRHIQQLFRTVMRISEIETGRCQHQQTDIDCSGLLTDVRDYYEVLAEQRGMQLLIRVETKQRLRGDRALLLQALLNLLDNALKYAPAGSCISLLARGDQHAISLGIADQGPGIAPAQRELAVQRFQRLERDRGSGSGGHGLGLALVAAVAALHDGCLILADSVGTDLAGAPSGQRGLTALLRLPHARGAASATPKLKKL